MTKHDAQLNLYQHAIPAHVTALADKLDTQNAFHRADPGLFPAELEVPALRVMPKPQGLGSEMQQLMSTTSLFVGSANGVFTTWTGPTGTRVFVKPVRHTVPRTWPGGCVFGTMDVVGVQLVDESGTELVAQFRPL